MQPLAAQNKFRSFVTMPTRAAASTRRRITIVYRKGSAMGAFKKSKRVQRRPVLQRLALPAHQAQRYTYTTALRKIAWSSPQQQLLSVIPLCDFCTGHRRHRSPTSLSLSGCLRVRGSRRHLGRSLCLSDLSKRVVALLPNLARFTAAFVT